MGINHCSYCPFYHFFSPNVPWPRRSNPPFSSYQASGWCWNTLSSKVPQHPDCISPAPWSTSRYSTNNDRLPVGGFPTYSILRPSTVKPNIEISTGALSKESSARLHIRDNSLHNIQSIHSSQWLSQNFKLCDCISDRFRVFHVMYGGQGCVAAPFPFAYSSCRMRHTSDELLSYVWLVCVASVTHLASFGNTQTRGSRPSSWMYENYEWHAHHIDVSRIRQVCHRSLCICLRCIRCSPFSW